MQSEAILIQLLQLKIPQEFFIDLVLALIILPKRKLSFLGGNCPNLFSFSLAEANSETNNEIKQG